MEINKILDKVTELYKKAFEITNISEVVERDLDQDYKLVGRTFETASGQTFSIVISNLFGFLSMIPMAFDDNSKNISCLDPRDAIQLAECYEEDLVGVTEDILGDFKRNLTHSTFTKAHAKFTVWCDQQK